MRVPILRLGDILLASIQEDLTDHDAIQFQSDLANTMSRTDATGVVIDISALDVVDSFLARILNDTASIVLLLGGEAVICGMQPAVAVTLIEMGRELLGVQTALNLQQGMEKLKDLLAAREEALNGE